MEQEQLLLQRPQIEQINQKLQSLFKKAFEIRQIQIMVMKDVEEKYKTLTLVSS
jgi:hypothetical protein